jgi:hypothetical protein
MHLLAISLLTILAGTLLLAKFKKDMPGKFFAFISWFFIVVGFILFIGFIAGGICKIAHHGFHGRHNFQHEMMMKDCNHGTPGGFCCPNGMDMRMCSGGPGGMPHDSMMKCCPKGMDKGMCSGKPGCMPNDNMMKCCPKHMQGDSAKVPALKK